MAERAENENLRDWYAIVKHVLRSLVLEASVDIQSELKRPTRPANEDQHAVAEKVLDRTS